MAITMSKKIIFKYWFVHGDAIGNIYENEKGNWVIVFDGILRVGEPILVRSAEGLNIDPDEIGLNEILRDFILPS